MAVHFTRAKGEIGEKGEEQVSGEDNHDDEQDGQSQHNPGNYFLLGLLCPVAMAMGYT